MIRQENINNRQYDTNKRQAVLNEDTKIDFKVNSIWAILTSVVISSFIFGGTYAVMIIKLDNLLASQNEMKQDFKEWKKQWEARLGEVEKEIYLLTEMR